MKFIAAILVILLTPTLKSNLTITTLCIPDKKQWDQNFIWESSDGSFKFKINSANNHPAYQSNFYRRLKLVEGHDLTTNSYNHRYANTKSIVSAIHNFFSESWQDDPNYFAKKFQNLSPTETFHYFYHYQHVGFSKYVMNLPGFEEFIETLSDQLHNNSNLAKKFSNIETRQKCINALQSMHNDISRKKLHLKLKSKSFDQNAINFLESHQAVNEFSYRCNSNQSLQLQEIALHINDLAKFELENHNNPELKNISDSSTTFTLMANNANKQNRIKTSGLLLNIARGFLALGKGAVKGAANAVQHGVDTVAKVITDPTAACQDLINTACDIGTSIAKLAYHVAQFDTAVEQVDKKLLSKLQQEEDAFFESIENQLSNMTYLELLESLGSGVADAVITNMMCKFAVSKTAQGVSKILDQLGKTGKKIKQATGLEYAKKYRALIAGKNENISVNILKQEAIKPVTSKKLPNTTFIKLAKIEKFDKGLAKLSKRYNNQILKDAQQAMRVNEYKIIKVGANELLREVEDTCTKIKKVVTSKPHRKNFIYDVDHSFKATQGSIMEAITACAAEDQGFFKELYRGKIKGVDFTDKTYGNWDFKAGYSYRPKVSNYKFKIEELLSQVNKAIYKQKNVLVDITNLYDLDLKKLKHALMIEYKNTDIQSKLILLHRNKPFKSEFII